MVHTENIIMITTYFLYKGALPAMSDKNIITLQKKMERKSLNMDQPEKLNNLG